MTDWQDSLKMDVGLLTARVYAPDPDLSRSRQLRWLADLLACTDAEGRSPRIDEVSARLIGTAALPTVMIVDLVGTPPRYRIRLIGTKLAHMAGRDSTGRFFDELADRQGAAHDFYMRQFDHIAQSGEAITIDAELYYRRQSWQRFRAIWAPLVDTQGRIARIASALEAPEPQRARRSLL